jgi:cell division protein FtsQ
MARERIEFTPEEEPRNRAAAREETSARALDLRDIDDLEDGEEVRFLRTEKRVPVRRGPLAKKTVNQLRFWCTLGVSVAFVICMGWAAYAYGKSSARFRIVSSDNIEISGVRNASRAEVLDAFHEDISKNIFFVPLEERRTKLEQIPWVESATVMRLLPNRLALSISERTPVAFVLIGSKTHLIDANGVLMGPSANRQTAYSFPVIRGISETEPLSSRGAVMKIYIRMVTELDSGDSESTQYSRQLSEIDLSNPKDIKATVNDAGGTVLVHFGTSDFLERYKVFAAHIGEWRKQYKCLQSVSLLEDQIVVDPDTCGSPRVEAASAPPVAAPPKPAVAQAATVAHPSTRSRAHHKWQKKGK